MGLSSGWLKLATVAALAALPAAADAYCQLPAAATSSPRAAAQWLFETSDILGFAIVRTRENAAAGQAETLELVFPIKGAPGPVSMRLNHTNGTVTLTDSATTFGVAPGAMVFAALNMTPNGAVISECKSLLLSRMPRDQIVTALGELWRRGDIPHRRRR